MGIKVLKDNFVWKTLDFNKAEALFKAGLPVFALHSDDSESLIENMEELIEHASYNDIGLQVGYIPTALNSHILYYIKSPELQTLDPNEGIAETTGLLNITVYKSIHGTLVKIKVMQLNLGCDVEKSIRESCDAKYKEHKLLEL